MSECGRRVHGGRDDERRGHHAQPRQIGQSATDDERADGVADGHDEKLGHRPEVAAAHVDTGQYGHAGEADDQPGEAAPVEVFAGAEQAVEQRAYQRHRSDQKPSHRAGHMLLGVGQEQPWQGQLGQRVSQHPAPAPEQRAKLAAAQSERDQQQRRRRRAEEEERRWRELAHRHPDEQVRDPPDEAQRTEQEPALA